MIAKRNTIQRQAVIIRSVHSAVLFIFRGTQRNELSDEFIEKRGSGYIIDSVRYFIVQDRNVRRYQASGVGV